MSSSATGHIVIRRQPKDGKPGDDGAKGASVRWRTYKAGEAYMSGAGEELYYDLVFHVGYQQFFRCLRSYPASETHSPSQSASNGYWEYQPGLDNLFVDLLCANEAFLNKLTVRQIYAADGKTVVGLDGVLHAKGGVFEGRLQLPYIRSDGGTLTTSMGSCFMLTGDLILPSSSSFNGWIIEIFGNPMISKSDIQAGVKGSILVPQKVSTEGSYTKIYKASWIVLSHGGYMKLVCVGSQWTLIDLIGSEPYMDGRYSYSYIFNA